MFLVPVSWHNNSLKIASTLEDIGVNERMVLKRRRSLLVQETMQIVTAQLTSYDVPKYYFGSQSEGTTTIGLDSDTDLLYCINCFNVIQMLEEWKPGARNYMMIQDENTTPGYCFLQQLYCDEPLPVTVNRARYKCHAIYKRDKVILKNTYFHNIKRATETIEGAAITASLLGYSDLDQVYALPCKSFPRLVREWLYKHEQTGTISNQMKRYIESNPCLVVPTGRKGSPYEVYEWRISTSFIERCLMFSLNITQLQCYVMMKLTLKTYFNYSSSKLLSSFVCKNIVLHSMQCIPFDAWQPHNLLNVFTFCLLKLKQCVLKGECPHFIIHGNNLLRRKLTTESKAWLVERIDLVIRSNGCAFLSVKIDDFFKRFISKFIILNKTSSVEGSSEDLSMPISPRLLFNVALEISSCHREFLDHVMHGISDLCKILRTMTEIYFRGSYLEQYACRLLTPLLCSTFGSIKASDDIHSGNTISPESLRLIYLGLNSDVASSRLKLASVLYCVGKMNEAETILTQIEEKYHLGKVETLCRCCSIPGGRTELEQLEANEDAIHHTIAFCVRFLPSEINCIPHELRYEMFRSSSEDMPHRGLDDCWMDWAVIDSDPYLCFLQYKIYSRHQKYDDKWWALTSLAFSIFTTRNLSHRETALNLLGQCMEQENQYQDAFLAM